MELPANARLRQFAPWLLVLAGAIAAATAYLQALHYPFVGDDGVYIATNQGLANLPFADLWRLLFRPYNIAHEFLPLRDLSYWIDMKLFGQDAAPYRLHNVLLYLLCLPLLYANTAALWRYFRPNDMDSAPWAAATVTALFAIHPALVESVVWISGRKYILPDFFSLLAIWLALKSRGEHGLSSRYAAATLAAFVCVMFSKSSHVGVAPIIAMLWLRFRLDLPAPLRHRSLLLWPAAIMLLAVFLLAVFIVNNQGFDPAPLYFGIEAVYRSLGILGGLTRISLTPEHRHYFYPLFEDPWFPAMVALGAIMLLASAWGGMAFLRRRSFAGFVLLTFFLLCLPYLQLVPAKPPSFIADRYVSLAIWPAVLMLTMLAWRLKPATRLALLLPFAIPWTYQTMERPLEWHNDETLISIDLHSFPQYFTPASMISLYYQMGNDQYGEASKTASRVHQNEIRDVLTKLVRADYVRRIVSAENGKPDAPMNLLLELGRMLKHPPPESRWNTTIVNIWERLEKLLAGEWQRMAEKYPKDVSVQYNAGVYDLSIHYYPDAARNLRAATKLQRLPESLRSSTYFNLGVALLRAGQPEEAEKQLNAALQQPYPDMRANCALATLYEQTGQPSQAARAMANCPKQ